MRDLADNLREVSGSLPGMPLGRRMTVIRLSDGRLVIHNAIALETDAMAALEAWGRPAFLVVPNGYHRLDAFAFKQRYPDLVVIAAPDARPKVEQALPVDGGPELIPAGLGLLGEVLEGTKIGEMAFTVTHGDGSKTVIVNDAIFALPHQPGISGFFMKIVGSTGGPKVTRIMRWFGVSDREGFKRHLLRIAETPELARLVVSHGELLEGEVASVLRAVAERDL
jgi:hypothetical protein